MGTEIGDRIVGRRGKAYALARENAAAARAHGARSLVRHPNAMGPSASPRRRASNFVGGVPVQLRLLPEHEAILGFL